MKIAIIGQQDFGKAVLDVSDPDGLLRTKRQSAPTAFPQAGASAKSY